MENPFIITGKIKPEYFCNREGEAERIIRKVTIFNPELGDLAKIGHGEVITWLISLLLEEYKKYLL